MKSVFLFAAMVAVGVGTASAASSVVYTCASNVDTTQAGTCTYLNTTLASLYTSTFNNVQANIYIEQSASFGLGASQTYFNFVTYSAYRNAILATASGDAVDTGAKAALLTIDQTAYGANNVEITSALGSALGFTGLTGITSGGASCIIGSGPCYNGIIYISTPGALPGGQTLYWDQTGGFIPGNAYDYYSVVQHETDELLGTASCISTQGASLTNACGTGSNTAAAIDLFRYNSAGNLAMNNALASVAPGAYFSYDQGVTNGAAGATFNTLSNGHDYADFTQNCAHVQDAVACLGTVLNITSDGNAEINMLNAVGYNTNATPEPGTWLLLGGGLIGLAGGRKRFSQQ